MVNETPEQTPERIAEAPGGVIRLLEDAADYFDEGGEPSRKSLEDLPGLLRAAAAHSVNLRTQLGALTATLAHLTQERDEATSRAADQAGKLLQSQLRVSWLEGIRLPHARKQEDANGFQRGWHAALSRVREGDAAQELAALVPEPAANVEIPVCEAEATLARVKAQRDELRNALVKVRAHTSYVNPTDELLRGLLQSIERIADAALVDPPVSSSTAQADDESRCAICGWTLKDNISDGCVRGNCSMRPFPESAYSPARAAREYGPVLDISRFKNGRAVSSSTETKT